MEELLVSVEQTVGIIQWNYEELKAQLEESLHTYETMIYTDENITDAKSDLAMLRRTRKNVEDCRKDIKNKCLEPYAVVESQANELTSLIDKPIKLIDEKVKEFDKRQRLERKNRILEYMQKKFEDLPAIIAQRLKFKCYDSMWENASMAVKEWKSGIDAAYESCMADIARLNDTVEEEYLPEAMKVYEKNLNVEEAERAYNQYLQHKLKIMEAEQRRKEEELRRQQDAQEQAIRQAEARARAEEAERIRKEQEAARTAKIATERQQAENVPSEGAEADTRALRAQEWHSEQEEEATELFTPYAIVRITGSREQIEKIKGYARYCGASLDVLEEG